MTKRNLEDFKTEKLPSGKISNGLAMGNGQSREEKKYTYKLIYDIFVIIVVLGSFIGTNIFYSYSVNKTEREHQTQIRLLKNGLCYDLWENVSHMQQKRRDIIKEIEDKKVELIRIEHNNMYFTGEHIPTYEIKASILKLEEDIKLTEQNSLQVRNEISQCDNMMERRISLSIATK